MASRTPRRANTKQERRGALVSDGHRRRAAGSSPAMSQGDCGAPVTSGRRPPPLCRMEGVPLHVFSGVIVENWAMSLFNF
ncbi:unnamed protein product [Boreogadus saida]